MILVVSVLLSAIVPIPNAFASGEDPTEVIDVFVDGQRVEFSEDQSVFKEGQSIMAPIDPIAEKACWYCQYGEESTIIMNNTGVTVEVFPDINRIKVNNVDKVLEVAPVLVDDILVVPIEDIRKN